MVDTSSSLPTSSSSLSKSSHVPRFRYGIESGGFKQCDTFFKNLLPAQICASSGPIDGSVELNLDYFAFLAESKVCLREKLSDGLRRFSWVSAWLFTKKGGEDKMHPVRVKWIALPLCTIGLDRNFDSPIAFFYGMSPLSIATSGREGP